MGRITPSKVLLIGLMLIAIAIAVWFTPDSSEWGLLAAALVTATGLACIFIAIIEWHLQRRP